jgi:hypothetical protein
MHTVLRTSLFAALSTIPLALTAADAARDPGMVAIEDDRFAAGATVELAEPITGDALLAGGLVESNASVGGDATMAGGKVAVRATVGDDLYVAGGEVDVDALVAGNARIAAGRVRIAPETRVAGGLAMAGGTVEALGSVGRYLTIAGGDVTLGGTISGDVRVYADALVVMPGTRIGGRLSYRTSKAVTLPADLQVDGGVAQPGARPDGRGVAEEDGDNMLARLGWVWLAGLFAVAWLLALAFAQFSRRTTAVLTENPWAGMGIGSLVLVGVPVVAAALFVTLIGIPLALILLMLYLGLLIGGYVIGVLYLGDRALATVRPGASITTGWRLGAFVAVLVALAMVSALPVLGGIARFAVLALGSGGFLLAAWRRDRPAAPPASAPAA